MNQPSNSQPNSSDTPRVLVGDIGGTNIRLAIAQNGIADKTTAQKFQIANFTGPGEAINHYLSTTGTITPDAACLAVAGPIVDRAADMTNSPWDINAEEIEAQTGITTCALLNDFEALALSLPILGPSDLKSIGGGAPQPGTRAVLGPGTGLGVSILARGGDSHIAMPGEGGHVGFAPVTELEIEILRHLTKLHGRVSAERLICGSGLEGLHQTLAHIEGRAVENLSAEEIVTSALAGDSASAQHTIEIFCAIFGTVAGDLALVSGAVGGVYLAGGIAQALAGTLPDTQFRERFEAKGRLSCFTQAVPTYVIISPYAALDGAAAAYANLHGPTN